MAGKIYQLNEDKTLSELVESQYITESVLQEFIAIYPDLLAGDQINAEEPRRWLFITREFSVPGDERENQSGYLDHLFLDQEGIPTLVEVKRSSDTRIRREVVGQMLDYAANAVVFWSVEKIIQAFEDTCEVTNTDPVGAVADLLQVDPSIVDIDQFWDRVKNNLRGGKVRMVFVADVIPPSLQRIVEFLNSQMDNAEVVAIEIKQFEGAGLKTLVPRVIGQTAEAQRKSSTYQGTNRQWTAETFYAELSASHSERVVQVAKSIEDWAHTNTDSVWWGKGKTIGSFVPVVFHDGHKHQLFAVWTNGGFEVYFQWYAGKPGFDSEEKRLELLAKLNAIPGVNIDPSRINSRPSIDLSSFTNEDSLQSLLSIFDWFIEEVKAG